MKLQKLTRKQIREQLDQVPIDKILGVPTRNLTHKQQKFCENVAKGETGAEAYRMAYGRDGAKAKPKVAGNRASKLKESEVIKREIEAIRTALEFEKSHTTAQLRALVVSQLTKEALDPDNNSNARLIALKALGTVAGVDAFQHISQSTIIKDSSESRAELMEKLKQAIADNPDLAQKYGLAAAGAQNTAKETPVQQGINAYTSAQRDPMALLKLANDKEAPEFIVVPQNS